VGGETRVDDVLNGRMRSQEAGNAECVQTMGLHPHGESFGAALGEPAVECTRDGAVGILEETELLGKAVVVSVWCRRRGEDSSAHYDIRMAVDVFCEGVNDDVSTLEEWGGIEWREKMLSTRTRGFDGAWRARATIHGISISRRVGFVGDSIQIS
jgi:hypothetical protein